MHRGFNLQLSNSAEWLKWKSVGESLYSRDEEQIREAIEDYVEAGVVDGAKLQSHWFGHGSAHIFISHSHRDEGLAVAFAGWLHNQFGLRAFIDSCVWGHADDLQRQLDKKYCKNPAPASTYDYDKRNITTSHVHMMLSTALMDMIDKTECFFFLHTDESIVHNDVKTTVHQAVTTSPWLYAELQTSRLLRRRPTGRIEIVKRAMESDVMDSVSVEYPAHLSHLTAIDDALLAIWCRSGKSSVQALDHLYDICS